MNLHFDYWVEDRLAVIRPSFNECGTVAKLGKAYGQPAFKHFNETFGNQGQKITTTVWPALHAAFRRDMQLWLDAVDVHIVWTHRTDLDTFQKCHCTCSH